MHVNLMIKMNPSKTFSMNSKNACISCKKKRVYSTSCTKSLFAKVHIMKPLKIIFSLDAFTFMVNVTCARNGSNTPTIFKMVLQGEILLLKNPHEETNLKEVTPGNDCSYHMHLKIPHQRLQYIIHGTQILFTKAANTFHLQSC